MNNKLVSVIITTHNRTPDVVLRAVNSALRQTYQNIEIIVVDDSANDFIQREEVEKTVRSASDNIVYIKHSRNMGGCAARNTGVSVATGFYIAFLDDDDEWLPEKIEEQVKGFSNDSIALVYSGFWIINDISGQKKVAPIEYKDGHVFNSLLYGNYIGGTSNPIIKKDVVESIGRFDVSMQSSQDYDLWLRITRLYLVNYIDKLLWYYHVHDQERISSNIDKKIAGFERINEKYSDALTTDRKAGYIRRQTLIPLYVEKGWSKKAYAMWVCCVKDSPMQIVSNLKYLLLIIFGFDSLPYCLYRKMKCAIRHQTG